MSFAGAGSAMFVVLATGLVVAVSMPCLGQMVLPAERSAGAGAPEVQGLPVGEVLVSGNKLMGEEFILGQLRTRVGQPYNERTVQEDVRNLLRLGRFDNVIATRQVADGKVIVTFAVVEKPEVQSVEFVGNKAYADKELWTELDFAAGDALDRYRVNQGRAAIERLYKQAGYNYVAVDVDEQVLRDQWRVVYRIVEGPQVRVRKIRFEGNRAFSRQRLQKYVRTKTWAWVFRSGRYDAEQVQRDADDLRNFYRKAAYLDAQVTPRLEFRPNRTDLDVTFLISEGPRYLVRVFHFEGNSVFNDDELLAMMNLCVGQPYVHDVAAADVKRITQRYGELGYIYARVEPDFVYGAGEDAVDVRFRLSEGDLYRVGRIVVRGNERTQDRVIRRELRVYPGQPYDLSSMERAEQRLYETRLFSDAKIKPLGEEPGLRDALVDITETETSTLLFGVAVGSDNGVMGNVAIENRNFDLFDWPRSFGELFGGRAFKGAGQTMRLQFEPGTEVTRGRIDFREPYLLDRPISLGVSGYVFQRGRPEFAEERGGGMVSFGRRFQSGFLKDWIGEIALRAELIDIGGTDLWTAREILEDVGTSTMTSAKVSLVRDRTDSFFRPSRGDRFSVSLEQAGALGGDYSFSKLSLGYWWHRTLRTDVFERKSILSVRGKGGYIFGDVPVFERFFGGGIGSIRGFEFRGASPRAGLADDRIGGRFLVLSGAEYSFPVYGKNLRGLLFTDMGTVEEDFGLTEWRVSVGFGVRILVRYFGPIPLSFDFGFPISKGAADDEQVFSFTFGATF